LKQRLLRDIVDGVLAPGELMPTEKDLERTHQVSRITVRRALDELAAEGYVTRRAGPGTTVLHRKITHTGGRVGGLEEDLARQGFRISSRVLFHARVPAPEHAARALRTKRGAQVLAERRITYADDKPLVYGESFHNFPPEVVFTQDELAVDYILRLVRSKFGMEFGFVDRSMEAILPDAELAMRLGIEPTSPVLVAELVVHDVESRPTSLVRASYRGDMYRYSERVHV